MKFRQTIVIIAICLSAFCSAHAQEIAVSFTSMPGDLAVTLEINRRKDLVDLYNEKKEAKVKNALNEETELKKMTDKYLLIQSGVYKMEMMLLSLVNHSQIICMIQTVCSPVCDSNVSFYTTDWQKLHTEDFFVPAEISQFFKENAGAASNNLIEPALSDISLMQYQLNPDDLTLLQTYTTPQYWSKEELKQIEPLLKKEPKVFKWQKNQFQAP